MAEYFGEDYTNIGTTSDPVWRNSGSGKNIRIFDTGWVDTYDGTSPVGNLSVMTFRHGLGEYGIGSVCKVYAAEDAQGLNMQAQDFLFYQNQTPTNVTMGIQVHQITSTHITIQLTSRAYWVSDTGQLGSKFFGSSEGEFSHIRLVLIAGS